MLRNACHVFSKSSYYYFFLLLITHHWDHFKDFFLAQDNLFCFLNGLIRYLNICLSHNVPPTCSENTHTSSVTSETHWGMQSGLEPALMQPAWCQLLHVCLRDRVKEFCLGTYIPPLLSTAPVWEWCSAQFVSHKSPSQDLANRTCITTLGHYILLYPTEYGTTSFRFVCECCVLYLRFYCTRWWSDKESSLSCELHWFMCWHRSWP